MQLNSLSRAGVGSVCQICQFYSAYQRLQTRRIQTLAAHFRPPSNQASRVPLLNSRRTRQASSSRKAQSTTWRRHFNDRPQAALAHAAIGIGELQREADRILKHEKVPSEEETLAVLRKFEGVTDSILGENRGEQIESQGRDGTPASALLSLDGKPSPPISAGKTVELISNLAYTVVKHPTVFISPQILQVYTTLQASLQRPSTLPEIFDLYASKPIPQPNTYPIKYTTPNHAAAANAIPYRLATLAINSAITTKSLPTALSIIETSFRAPAYQRSKALKSGLPPIIGFSLAPFAAYALASHFSLLSNALDPAIATPAAAAGILAYVGCVGTIGFVAIATANDQMRRVTWVDGTRLWERWIREEERAAVDRVALAWGLRGTDRWGEEEGPEWEFLREWVSMRGMVLDRVSLMEGME
ncbi:hypothetical protein EV356DRAFT_501083 [Viridothelium virens]|uniref:Uncharacterized protein n=1 Tax=Viridothelium virens TaxID=1048519 RepID=A0A6A6HAI4_VIRVR|nr:hypothetical protein EV356DRAFT_501083 [Viridothelium virens]